MNEKVIGFTNGEILPNVGDVYVDSDGEKYVVTKRVLKWNNVLFAHMEKISKE